EHSAWNEKQNDFDVQIIPPYRTNDRTYGTARQEENDHQQEKENGKVSSSHRQCESKREGSYRGQANYGHGSCRKSAQMKGVHRSFGTPAAAERAACAASRASSARPCARGSSI